MRKLVLAPVLLLAFAVAAPSPVLADAGPAMRADTSSFELFGTRFCYGPAEGCDVTFAAEPERELLVVAPVDDGERIELFGLTLCSEVPRGTAPHCDVAWSPPPPAARWRDLPEIRVLAALDRYY